MEEENNIEKGLLLVNREETASTTPLLVFSTFIIVCASFSYGIAAGYTADTMSSIMKDLDLSLAQFSLFGSLATFGGMFGAISSAKAASVFGNKKTLWLADLFCITGWLAIALAKNIVWLDFGRFCVGIGIGLISYVVPVYIAEITPKHIRGTFTFTNQLLQNCGVAIAYYFGNFLSWRILAVIGIIPCGIQVIGLFFIPESPRWLAKKGRDKEVEVVLQKLRGKGHNIVVESREIKISVEVSKQNSNISIRSLFRKRYAHQLTIGIGLMLLQQLCGTAGISSYGSTLFKLGGFPARIGMTVLSLIVVPKSLMGLLLVDRWGRRPLLMMASNDNLDMNENAQADDMSDGSDEDVHTPTPTDKGKGKVGHEGSGSGTKSRKRACTGRSWVWEHFTRQEEDKDKANCHYCKREMVCPSKSGTSNMKKHLNHSCKPFKVWEAAKKFSKDDQTVIDVDAAGLRLSKVSDSVVWEATNELMVISELPLSFVEGLGWKHFCSKVKLVKPRSRRTSTREIVEQYMKKKEDMKRILGNNKQRVSLTTDIWVAPHTGSSYMVITAHFVDAWWQMKKMIIGFKNVYDHKGATIAKVLKECLEEWNIKRVFCITVDNATANSSAMRIFREEFSEVGDDAFVLGGEYLHLRCATHILNLIVRDGLQEIDYSVNAIRNSIYYVRSSTPRLSAFESYVQSRRIQRGSLPLDVKTRWNSTYLMLEQALKFKTGFVKMQEVDKLFNDYFDDSDECKQKAGPPLRSDWEAVERLVQFLIIFYKATLALSTSNSACSHKLWHAIVTVTRNISALSLCPGPDTDLRKKAIAMLSKLGKYWDPFGEQLEFNRMSIVAGVLDPSKKMKFAIKCFEKLWGKNSKESALLTKDIEDILENLYKEYSE